MRKKEKRTAMAVGVLAVGALSGLYMLINHISVSAQTNQQEVVEVTTDEHMIIADVLDELPPIEEVDGALDEAVEDQTDEQVSCDEYAMNPLGECDEDDFIAARPTEYELSEAEVLSFIRTYLQENYGEEITDIISLIDVFFMRDKDFTYTSELGNDAIWHVMVLGESGVSIEELNPLDPILFVNDDYDYAIDYLQNFPIFHFTIDALTGEIVLFEDNREEVIDWSYLRASQLQELNPDLDFSDRDAIREALN